MSEATIVYPHQLFKDSPALTKERPVYIVEESLLLTHNPIHLQKLILHKLTLDAYETELQDRGLQVIRISITDCPKTTDVFTYLKKAGVKKVHIIDTTDCYLEQAIATSGLERVWYDSPLFLLTKADAVHRYKNSKRFMASFYKQLRRDTGILMDGAKPSGGAWSFDSSNRQKLPKHITLPEDITVTYNQTITAAGHWAKDLGAEAYGEGGCWLPYTHAAAETYMQEFLHERLRDFGSYEDALSEKSVRLFHSTLSPLLNIGLLTPKQVLDTALSHAKTHHIPINSLEGFVRQILGWREFIRAAYESDGVTMRTRNFWNHRRTLSIEFWNGETTIEPLDLSIKRALRYGYTHHIERLMVLGNFMLLAQIHPDEVYRWFMGMYLDAYDWVMVPNVYGMSQFADGGLFATKPYISGSSYIKKMSDYTGGTWEELWTALYWNFINNHQEFFASNHRLSMMPRLLEKMDTSKRSAYLKKAQQYLQST